jgi:hypothetical protein
LRDGGKIRVPLFMADGASAEDAREAAYQAGYRRGLSDARRRKGVQYDPQGREVSRWEEEEEEGKEDSAGTADKKTRVTRYENFTEEEEEDGMPAKTLDELFRDGERIKAVARDEMIRDMANAWKDAVPPTGAGEGDKLVCRAKALQPGDSAPRPTLDAAEAQRIKDEAWRASLEEKANAWKSTK